MTGRRVGPPADRYVFMDVARIVAIVAVICIHVMSLVPAMVPRDSGRWWLGVSANAASRWSVPVFVMISGALLLAPGRPESPASFYRRRLLRVGLPAVVWIALYYVFRVLVHHERLTPRQVGRELLYGGSYYHLYFLYAILGLYLITPFLRVFVRTATRAELGAATGLALGLAAVNQLLGATVGISSPTYALTTFVPYVGYFLAGFFLRDVRVSASTAWLLAAAALASVAAEVAFSARLTRHSMERLQVPMSYFSALTIVMSLAMFLLLARWAGPAGLGPVARRRLSLVSACTFGVYLAHPMVLDRLYFWLHLTRGSASAATLVGLIGVTAVVTLAAVLVLRQVPGVRRLS